MNQFSLMSMVVVCVDNRSIRSVPCKFMNNDPHRRYTCKQVVKMLVDLPSDEELSEDDEECVSDDDTGTADTADCSEAVAADTGTFSDTDTDTDNDTNSDTLPASGWK